MARFHIQPWAKVGSLKASALLDLTAELSNMKIENDLRREIQDNIVRLKDMGSYRGRRHAMGLPVRGQRTRSQVSALSVDHCGEILTAVDRNCEEVEQDAPRRRWEIRNVDMASNLVGYCTMLYNINLLLGSLGTGGHHIFICSSQPYYRVIYACSYGREKQVETESEHTQR